MYTIKENLRPIAQKYDQWLNGYYLSGLLRFKGQEDAGGDYISKVFKSQSYQINRKYQEAALETQYPTYTKFVKDNLFRFVALSGTYGIIQGIQRLATACQGSLIINRLGRPSTTSFLFTQIMNEGVFRGTLKGAVFNFLQASLVLWPTTYITNRSGGGLFQFIATYTIVDALLYPLDKLKTLRQAHTFNAPQGTSVHSELERKFPNLNLVRLQDSKKQIKNIISSHSNSYYRGFLYKAIFNIPYAGALYTTATGQQYSWAFWLATLLVYPLNTIKTILQLQGNAHSVLKNPKLFKGIVPFAFVNVLFAWQLTALFSKQKLFALEHGCKKESIQKVGFY